MWIGPTSYVACGVNARRACLKSGTDDDPSVELQACFLGELQTWSNAYAYNHQIGLDRATFLQADGFFVDGSNFVFEMKDHAVLLVEGTDEVSHIGAKNALHRSLIRRHHVDLQLARAQRGSDL